MVHLSVSITIRGIQLLRSDSNGSEIWCPHWIYLKISCDPPELHIRELYALKRFINLRVSFFATSCVLQ